MALSDLPFLSPNPCNGFTVFGHLAYIYCGERHSRPPRPSVVCVSSSSASQALPIQNINRANWVIGDVDLISRGSRKAPG